MITRPRRMSSPRSRSVARTSKGVVGMGIAGNIRPAAPARFPNLAPPPPSPAVLETPDAPVIRRRFRGDLVSLYEWHCAGHAAAHPAEEWVDAHEVVVPRRGAFQWEIAGER